MCFQIEFDLRTGSAEAYLGDDELAKIYSEKPIDMFRLYDKGAERILGIWVNYAYLLNLFHSLRSTWRFRR